MREEAASSSNGGGAGGPPLPTSFAYNHVINCAACTLGDVETKREAFRIALRAFVELRGRGGVGVGDGDGDGDGGKISGGNNNRDGDGDGDENCDSTPRPDSYTYAFFLKACNSLLPLGTMRYDIIARTFSECCDDGHLSDEAIERLRRGVPPDMARELLGGSGDYRRAGVDDLPKGWSCNVPRPGRRRRRR